MACRECSRSTIFRIGYLERGEYAPSLHLALQLAAHFDVPVEVIFSLELFPLLGSERAG